MDCCLKIIWVKPFYPTTIQYIRSYRLLMLLYRKWMNSVVVGYIGFTQVKVKMKCHCQIWFSYLEYASLFQYIFPFNKKIEKATFSQIILNWVRSQFNYYHFKVNTPFTSVEIFNLLFTSDVFCYLGIKSVLGITYCTVLDISFWDAFMCVLSKVLPLCDVSKARVCMHVCQSVHMYSIGMWAL